MTTAAIVTDIGRDPDAREAFYREHLDFVRRFVARRVTSPHDAADLTADVFLAAIGSCHRYDSKAGTPSAWLCGIARNVVAKHHRSSGRAERASLRFPTSEWLADDAIDRLAAQIDAEADARSVLAALETLPEQQRAVVELVAVDGLGLIDAAHALNISPTNARVRYHRARRHLNHTLPTIFEVKP